MARLLPSTLVLVIWSFTVARPDTIYDLIKSGHVDEARDSLSRQTSASVRDATDLFCQALLEPEGARAVGLIQAALASGPGAEYREEITYRLAQYYLMRKDYRRLAETVTEYQSRWEGGRYRGEMQRLSVLTDELSKEYESALRLCDRYLLDNSTGDKQHWGLVDKVRILKAHGKEIGAGETLRQLSRSKKGVGVPQSLYLLGMQAVARNKADDAIFYYNMLREAYPAAVGLDQLQVGLGAMTPPTSKNNKAETLTGTYYSVKVGVFSESANARKQADQFKDAGQKVDIETRRISGREYRVVYVGRFRDYDEATRFKLGLEAAHHETYQVVAR
ncbi:MAG: SPOR domain-containing protein [candidate division Zixibacteria bacterium]|nr:SPOR domain-containing protein [candidate division Zixibacteria bacterium]